MDMVTIELTQDELNVLNQPVDASAGGFQNLIQTLQDLVGDDGKMTLSPELIVRIRSYENNYGSGGYQDRLRIICDHLDKK